MQKAGANLIKELKKQKRQGDLLFLDNKKIIADALKKGVKPLYLLTEDESLTFGLSENVFKVDAKTIEMLSGTKTPQGVVCVAYNLQHTPAKPTDNFLVLDTIQDPGNAGTLIRTATACGFDSVFMLDCVSVKNSKLIRSSVGTIFDIKIYEMQKAEFATLAKKWKLELVSADMDGENVFTATFNQPVGLVVGNEGQGVSKDITKLCTRSVKIPMTNLVESLNAGVSGSIIMYQINKKRLSN